MKVVPLIVLAALVILPITIRFFYTIAKSPTKNSDATTSPENRKPRKLAYLAVAVYVLLLAAAGFWAASSLMSEFGLEEKTIIYSVITVLIIIIGFIIGFRLWFRYVRKKISSPDKETTPEAHLEWANKFADLGYKPILWFLLALVGYALVIVTLGCVIAYFLS
jgi:Na+/H+ antiporter NhaD/arsenite permease-like protein